MTSAINPLYPVEGTPTTESVRDNFLAAKNEIEALQSGKQDTLVSGSTIKTVAGKSVVGAGNVALTKEDVGLANVDNTSDANKPVSTAQAAAIAAAIATRPDTATVEAIAAMNASEAVQDHVAEANPHTQYVLGEFDGDELVGLKNKDNTVANISDPIAALRTPTFKRRGVAHRGGWPLSTIGSQLLGVSIFPVEAGTDYKLEFVGATANNEASSRTGTIQARIEAPFGSGQWYPATFNAVAGGVFNQTGSVPDMSNNYFRLQSDVLPFVFDEPVFLRVVLSAKGGVPTMSNYDGYMEGRPSLEFTIQNQSANDAALQLDTMSQAQLDAILQAVEDDGAAMVPRKATTAVWSGGTLTIGLLSHGITTSVNNKVVLSGWVNSGGTPLDGVYSFSNSGTDAITIAIAADPGTISQIGIVRLAQAITSATWSGGVLTVNRAAHGWLEGRVISIRGTSATGSSVNGDFPITSVPTVDSFTVAMPNSAGTVSTTNAYMFSKYSVLSADYHLRPFTISAVTNVACQALAGDSTTHTIDRIQDSTRLCGILQRCTGEYFPFVDLSANNAGLNSWLSNPGQVIIRTNIMGDLADGVSFGWCRNDESAFATIAAWKQAYNDWWDLPVPSTFKTSKWNTVTLSPSRSTTSRNQFSDLEAQVKPNSQKLPQFQDFLYGQVGSRFMQLFNYPALITVINQPYAWQTNNVKSITFSTIAGSPVIDVTSTPLDNTYNGQVAFLPGVGNTGADLFVRIRQASGNKFIAHDPVTGNRIPLPMTTQVTNGTGIVGARRYIAYSASQSDSLHENPSAPALITQTIALKRLKF